MDTQILLCVIAQSVFLGAADRLVDLEGRKIGIAARREIAPFEGREPVPGDLWQTPQRATGDDEDRALIEHPFGMIDIVELEAEVIAQQSEQSQRALGETEIGQGAMADFHRANILALEHAAVM